MMFRDIQGQVIKKPCNFSATLFPRTFALGMVPLGTQVLRPEERHVLSSIYQPQMDSKSAARISSQPSQPRLPACSEVISLEMALQPLLPGGHHSR